MSSSRWGHKLKENLTTVGNKVVNTASNVKDDITRKKNSTKDTEFSDIQKQFDEQNNLINQLITDATQFIGGTDAILKAQIQMATDLLKVAPPNSSMANMCQVQLETYTKMYDNKVEMFDKQLSSTFTDPINLYLGQFREISDRIRERGRRESEMDKLSNERDKFQEKGDPRMAATETKLEAAINSYSELNEELKKDMPKLLSQAQEFLEPLVVMFLINQATFWETMTKFSNELMAKNPDIRTNARGPQIVQVITPKAASSVTKKYSTTANNNPWEKNTGAPALTYNTVPAIEGNPYGQVQQQPGLLPPVPPSSSFSQYGTPQPPPPSAHPFPPHAATPPPGSFHPQPPPPSSHSFPPHTSVTPPPGSFHPQPPPSAHSFPPAQRPIPTPGAGANPFAPPPGGHHQPPPPNASFPSLHTANPPPGQRPVPTPGAGPNPFAKPANPFTPAPVRPPPPTTPTLPQAKVLWNFQGQDASELNLTVGDIVTIHEKNGDWWNGEVKGKRGLFPANYVELI